MHVNFFIFEITEDLVMLLKEANATICNYCISFHLDKVL